MKKPFFYLLPTIYLLLLISCSAPSPESPPQKEEVITLSSEDEKTILLAESEGYIRLEPEFNNVYVKAAFWNSLPYQHKETLGAMVAGYCAKKKGNSLYYANILDYNNGKKIAKYSKSWGFEIY